MQTEQATQKTRTYTVTLPEQDASLFRQHARRLGWVLTLTRKTAEQAERERIDEDLKADIEQARRDYAAGRGVTFDTAREAVAYLKSL